METNTVNNQYHKLVSDNLVDRNNNRYGVTATTSQIERACKQVLKWRSATKRYDTIIDRFYSSGSVSYDKIIKHLSETLNN